MDAGSTLLEGRRLHPPPSHQMSTLCTTGLPLPLFPWRPRPTRAQTVPDRRPAVVTVFRLWLEAKGNWTRMFTCIPHRFRLSSCHGAARESGPRDVILVGHIASPIDRSFIHSFIRGFIRHLPCICNILVTGTIAPYPHGRSRSMLPVLGPASSQAAVGRVTLNLLCR